MPRIPKSSAANFIVSVVANYVTDSQDIDTDLRRLLGTDTLHWRDLARAFHALSLAEPERIVSEAFSRVRSRLPRI